MMSFSSDPAIADVEMRAVLFILLGVGFVDGNFEESERTLVRDLVDGLVDRRCQDVFGSDAAAQSYANPRWKAHYYQVMSGIEQEIRAYFTESVPEGESPASFVIGKLKLRCLELLGHVAEQNRAALFTMITELMRADGVVSPAEKALYDDILALLHASRSAQASILPRAPRPIGRPTAVECASVRAYPLAALDDPFFASSPHEPTGDPADVVRTADMDIELMRQLDQIVRNRVEKGRGRLAQATSFGEFAAHAPFVDGYVHVMPPVIRQNYEILVLGDLHGCYSCLKGALLQFDFFGKLRRHEHDPVHHPNVLVVCLGDFIDRGLRSYDGVLRTVIQLFLAAPDHVVLLRGNHEHYFEKAGRIISPVHPAEAIASIASFAPHKLLSAYMRLFDILPTTLVFGSMMFVHAGIPRQDTMAARLTTLAGLNASDVRFQMVWADPSDADWVPPELQRNNTRFAFGRHQFRNFMATVGCTVMIRGHERVVEGFRCVYDEPDASLFSLFSAGGATNTDLPVESNYREVTPMALHIAYASGTTSDSARITPFPIAYERFC